MTAERRWISGYMFLFACVLVATLPGCGAAPIPPQPESGTITLLFLKNKIGTEKYTLTPQGEGRTLTAKFDATDRGGAIPVDATLMVRNDGTPEHFTAKGKTYRYINIDVDVTVKDGSVTVREQGDTKAPAPVPATFFTLRTFAPFSVQMMLLRYWNTHGRPPTVPLFPTGEARIEHRGTDTIQINGRSEKLERYSVDGAIWGGESIWLDANGVFAAATTYTGGLPFEAVREGYESALETFVQRGVDDRIEDLRRITQRVSPKSVGSTYAVVGARLIDGTGRPPIDDAAVLVKDGRIVSAGPRAQVKVPSDAQTIDAAGKTIIPGLWDLHAHYANIDWSPIYLAAGVTTARDMGGEVEFLTALRSDMSSGKSLGPRLLLAGWVDGGAPEGLGSVRADTDEQARAAVKLYHDARFDEMKLLNVLTLAAARAVATEAHKVGMMVTGHIPNGETAIAAIDAGYDQFAHSPGLGDPTSPEAKKQIAYFKQHGISVNTTESWSELQGRPASIPIRSFQPGIDKCPPELRFLFSAMGSRNMDEKAWNQRVSRTLAGIKAMYDAGIPIVAGSDKGVPGHSVLRELEIYVQAGLTPMQAIQAASSVPARVMKLDSEVGTLEAGKSADLVILDGNPLENISNVRTGRTVIARGKVYDTAALWRSVHFEP